MHQPWRIRQAAHAPPTTNPAISANTNDLRGKVLRIRVGQRGGYSIPAGNLFPAGMAGTRPEIYAMSFSSAGATDPD